MLRQIFFLKAVIISLGVLGVEIATAKTVNTNLPVLKVATLSGARPPFLPTTISSTNIRLHFPEPHPSRSNIKVKTQKSKVKRSSGEGWEITNPANRQRPNISPRLAQAEETEPPSTQNSDKATDDSTNVTNQNPETVDLKSNPNPLNVPTEPEQVEIKQIVPLTLEEALALAKENNRQLQIAKLQLESSRASLEQAEAELFPTVEAVGSATRQLDASGSISAVARRESTRTQIESTEASIPFLEQQIDAIDTELDQINLGEGGPTELIEVIQLLNQRSQLEQSLQGAEASLENSRNQLNNLQNFATTSLDGRLSLNYAVFSPRRQANISFFAEQVRFSELEVERIEQDLHRDVSLSYYNLQQADQRVRINEADVQARSRRLEGIQLMLEAALATRLDLLNAQVELGNALQSLRNSQTDQETARRELARLLNLPPSVTPVAADLVEVADQWNLSLQESIILALKNRVELQQDLAERDRAEADRRRELSAIQPEVSIFADYNILRLYTDDPSESAVSGYNDGYAFGVVFNWTFFDGGAAFAGARRAEANIAIAEQQYGDNADQIRLEVERAYLQLPAQLENLQTANLALEQAQEAVRAAELRFQATVNTQTEVLDAQNRLVQAENNLVNAILNYNRALAQLQRAVGYISDRDI